jgi:CheY-like chemotaxis protein
MPGEDGLEIIQAMRGKERRPKIIAMSGHAEPFLRIAAQLGADAVLSKPFTSQDLLLTIRHLLMPD